MRLRLTRSKGTLVFGIWVILLGIKQIFPRIPLIEEGAFLGLVAITAGVLLLLEL